MASGCTPSGGKWVRRNEGHSIRIRHSAVIPAKGWTMKDWLRSRLMRVNRWLGSRMLHGHNVSLLAWSGTAAEQSPRTQRRCPLLVRSLSACGCNGRQTRWPQRLQWTVQPFVHCCASVPKLEFCRLLKAKLCRDIS
eukprot:scaffold314567_cov19-Tisochrysis_lutea.AAC.1